MSSNTGPYKQAVPNRCTELAVTWIFVPTLLIIWLPNYRPAQSLISSSSHRALVETHPRASILQISRGVTAQVPRSAPTSSSLHPSSMSPPSPIATWPPRTRIPRDFPFSGLIAHRRGEGHASQLAVEKARARRKSTPRRFRQLPRRSAGLLTMPDFSLVTESFRLWSLNFHDHKWSWFHLSLGLSQVDSDSCRSPRQPT